MKDIDEMIEKDQEELRRFQRRLHEKETTERWIVILVLVLFVVLMK